MNIHENARTTPQSRALLVHRVLREDWPVSAVAMAFGMSERTVYKWLARFHAEGLGRAWRIGARWPIAAHMPWRRRGWR